MPSSRRQDRSALGSKRERRPGVWEVSVADGYRRDGSTRRAYGTVRGTEADADAWIRRKAAEMGRASSVGDPMTLDEYFWGHFSPGRHATTTNANANTYDSHWRSHVSPALGAVPLADLDNLAVQRWILTLPPQSAPAYARTLRAVLSQARFDHLIAESPMEGYAFRFPKGRRTAPLPVWAAEDVAEALSRPRFRESQLFALWCVMVGAGLSRSEALALDWEALSFSEVTTMGGAAAWVATVTVNGACTAEDGMKDPKNDRRYRRVRVMEPFSGALRAVAGTGPLCQSRRAASGGSVPSGHRLTPSYVPKRWKAMFAEGGELEGLPFVPLNRMRATYATIAQAGGVDATLINAAQGRSDGSQVLYSNYLNPNEDSMGAASAAVARAVSGA